MSESSKKELQGTPVSGQVRNYLKGVRSEWDKITWPEKKQVAVETVIVIGVVIFFTALIYLIDLVFNFMFGFLG